MAQVSVRKLFEDNQQKLGLEWLGGKEGDSNPLGSEQPQGDSPALIGHLNFIHPNRVQVLGAVEINYLRALDPSALAATINQLFIPVAAAAIVISDGEAALPALIKGCNAYNIPLLTSPEQSGHLMEVLRLYLAKALAISTHLHGVFMDVLEIGVMLTGESAMGKSELALELISRGHGLVADDVIEVFRIGPETLEGRCPAMLRDFLEVRGLGVLNIRAVFGETAVRPKKNLKLIIHLEKAIKDNLAPLDRLQMHSAVQTILDVEVRKITLPVAAGRNLAVLVETAVRNYILQLRGIDSTQEFIRRHHQYMENNHH